MVKIIYMRHSHDEYDDATHRHDHQITDLGKEKAIKVGKKLIDKYGVPNIIYCSPFKRTKQTMKYMLKNCDNKDNIEVIFDTNLSRFFSKKEQDDPSIFKDTGNVPTKETSKDFNERVDTHIENVKKMVQNVGPGNPGSKPKIIWCITHTLILKRVARYYEISLPRRLNFMENFTICSHCNKKFLN